jgi:hypothetical protein
VIPASLGLAAGATDPLTSSLVRAVGEAATDLGLTTRPVRDPSEERMVDVLLAVSLPQLYDGLLDAPRVARRIAWFGEPLPRLHDVAADADGTFGGRRLAGQAIRVLRRPALPLRRLPLPRPLDALRSAAYVEHERTTNLEAAIRRAGTVERVVVTSRDRAAVLAASGLEARVVPFGYHPALAGPIVRDGAPRDIPAVAFGSGLDWSSRRARGLRRCAKRLGPSRLGVTRAAWGPERDALLRRSRVLLDVHRIPGNFIGLRILFASAAGADLVTEPMDDPWPFEPGTHHVEAALDDLPAALDALLGEEARRRRIVDAAQALLIGPLSMATSLQRVLA